MCDLPLCRQFLCTHCNLRTCYRRAEKRCWVRDSCKPPGYTSPRLLPPRLPANPPFTLSFTHALPLFPSLCSVFHPLAPLHVRCSPPRGFLLSFFYDHFPGWLFASASILFGSTLFLHPFWIFLSLAFVAPVLCIFLHWFLFRLFKYRGSENRATHEPNSSTAYSKSFLIFVHPLYIDAGYVANGVIVYVFFFFFCNFISDNLRSY